MADFYIDWIDKPGGSHNPHTRIERLGGGNEWQDSEANVIKLINGHVNRYYVSQDGSTTWVKVAYRNSIPYLATERDETPLDNLLSLRNVSTVK